MEEIRTFLKKLLDESAANLAELERINDDLDIKIKENTRFLDILKKENEEPFSEFSPRNVNYKNGEQIDKLELTTNNQIVEKKNTEIRIDQCKIKIQDIKDMLGKLDSYDNTFSEKRNVIPNNDNSFIKESLDNIISYLPADPIRARIELENLKNNL
ncbi:MAG TPA: hypothetical protein DCR12_00030 [Lachnospiraceae bacterium]|nr:hypothetical protein [Lachnospiraceae bacterium]